ncbi:MAG: ATP-binding protein [Bacteroidota bacterium]|jgi:K+-sensing histidine kinase KdpD
MANNSSLIDKVRRNVLLEAVDESTLKPILPKLRERLYQAGELIFDDGSETGCLYLVLSGTVRIAKKMRFGEEVVLAVIHEGDFFGEMELIDNRPKSAAAIAQTDCSVVPLPREDFAGLVKKSQAFQQSLLRMLSVRLRTVDEVVILQCERFNEAAQRQVEKMRKLIDASKSVNSSLDVDKLLGIILETATSALNADRGTVYLIDDVKQELWSKVLQGASMVEIRLPFGKGIAGHVAATGETINIPDAYADSRFNPEVDKKSGYKTTTILCMPMQNKDGKTIGVFQLLNKKRGPFTKDDEELLGALSIHASIAVENAQLAQQMVSSERLSAVGRMASTIIHDIKNPMGTLRVYAQVMKKKSPDAEVTKLADDMMKQIDRFVNMTQEILDFSRGVSSTNIQECDFGELIEMVLTFVEKDLTKRNVQLQRNLQFAGTVKVDQDKLMRVFYNIAGNAADAMPNGGQLTVITLQKDGGLAIEFIDTGTGMPPEVKAKIFEPFVTYGKKHGTGLGMAIVKKIVDDHKGRIEIDSEMGKGTTVRLILPINPD